MKSRTKPNDAWTTYDPPWVEEVSGEPFRYTAQSRSEPGVHHAVDITQRGGHGCCTCEFFRFRANPNFKRHGKYIPFAPGREGVSECVHIRAAFDHYHQHVTMPMLHGFRNGIPRTNTTLR